MHFSHGSGVGALQIRAISKYDVVLKENQGMKTFLKVVLYFLGIQHMLWGFFICVAGMLSIGEDSQVVAVCLVLGLALIAVGTIPFFAYAHRDRRIKEEEAERQEKFLAAEQSKKMEALREKLERLWTCEHCGAATKGLKCEYCDSPYEGE